MPSTLPPVGATSVSVTSGFVQHKTDPTRLAIRMTYAGKIGIISAGLVIARRLCLIVNAHVPTPKERSVQIRTAAQDLTIGLSFPLAQFVICKYQHRVGGHIQLTQPLRRLVRAGTPLRHIRRRWLPFCTSKHRSFGRALHCLAHSHWHCVCCILLYVEVTSFVRIQQLTGLGRFLSPGVPCSEGKLDGSPKHQTAQPVSPSYGHGSP